MRLANLLPLLPLMERSETRLAPLENDMRVLPIRLLLRSATGGWAGPPAWSPHARGRLVSGVAASALQSRYRFFADMPILSLQEQYDGSGSGRSDERRAMARYVTICMRCPYEQYFVKQARANSARQAHLRINPRHNVRVARVRQPTMPPSMLPTLGQ